MRRAYFIIVATVFLSGMGIAAWGAEAPPVSQEQFAKLTAVTGLIWWSITFALIFFMQAGFMLLEAGLLHPRTGIHPHPCHTDYGDRGPGPMCRSCESLSIQSY